MLYIDLRNAADDSHIGILSAEQYASLPADQVANTIARFFVRCEAGHRVELGTSGELARAVGFARDYSAARVAVR